MQQVKLGDIEQLSRDKRKELRARARAERRVAAGVQLCGAKTRSGRPCIARALKNGRCKFHGGMSTGAKTPEGRAKSIAAVQNYWRKRKAEKNARMAAADRDKAA